MALKKGLFIEMHKSRISLLSKNLLSKRTKADGSMKMRKLAND